jgi:hypothetical protein
MKYLIALMLALTALTASAEDKDWGLVADLNGGMKIYGRYGSFERYDGAASMVVRFVSKDLVSFYIVGVSDKDCDAGYGQITFFDTNWKLIKRESYVAKGGNGIAYMGDLLCYLINKQKGQSL